MPRHPQVKHLKVKPIPRCATISTIQFTFANYNSSATKVKKKNPLFKVVETQSVFKITIADVSSLSCYVYSLQVQLLISTQDVDNYKHIKRDLDLLRTMVEKSELWVIKKGSSGGDGKKDKKDKKEAAPVSHALGDVGLCIIE